MRIFLNMSYLNSSLMMMWLSICQQANLYASFIGKMTFSVDKDEMRAFIAILLISGYSVVPRRQMWQQSQDVHNSAVSQFMNFPILNFGSLCVKTIFQSKQDNLTLYKVWVTLYTWGFWENGLQYESRPRCCRLDFVEMKTILFEVEAIVNSRLLTYHCEDDGEEWLMPNHLLFRR